MRRRTRWIVILLGLLLFVLLFLFLNDRFNITDQIKTELSNVVEPIRKDLSSIAGQINKAVSSISKAIDAATTITPKNQALLVEGAVAIAALGAVLSAIKGRIKLKLTAKKAQKSPSFVTQDRTPIKGAKASASVAVETLPLNNVPIKAAKSVPINKVGLLFSTFSAFFLSIVPATLVISQFDALPFFILTIVILTFVLATLIVAAVSLYKFKSVATEKPHLPEYAIGWIGTIAWGALTGIVLLIFYTLFLAGADLYQLITSWLGFEAQIDAGFIASLASLIIAFGFGLLFVGVGAKTLASQLYPNKAHTKSTFYELTTIGKRRIKVYIGVASFALVGLFLWVLITTGSFTTWWFNLLLLIFLFFISLAPFSMENALDPNLLNATKAVGRLFASIGYIVVPNPVTGKAEFDPLLVGLDYYVQDKEHALAVAVRTEKTLRKDQQTATDLLRSTWTLEFFLQNEPSTLHKNITPVIVSVGKRNKEWPTEVKTIEIPSQAVSEILTMNTQEELKETATRYLQFPVEKNLTAPQNSHDVSGGKPNV